MPLRRLIPLFALLLGLMFLGLVGRSVLEDWRKVQRAALARHSVDQLRLSLQAAEMVSRERGPTNGALGAARPLSPEQAAALRAARERTDQAFAALRPVLAERDADPHAGALSGAAATPAADLATDPATDPAKTSPTARRLQQALQQARAGVDALVALPREGRDAEDIRRAVAAMVAVVPLLAPTAGLLANAATQELPTLSDAVQGARLSAELREYAGLLGSQFTAPLTRQRPFDAAEVAAIERTRGRIDELRFLIELRVRLPGQDPEVLQAWQLAEEHYFLSAGHLLAGVMAAGAGDGHYGMDPAAFAARYVPDMNTLFALRDVLLRQAVAAAQAESDRANRSLWLTAATGLLLGALLLAGMVQLQRRLLRPLVGVREALNALAHNDSSVPLPVPLVADEMAGVVGAVAQLQQRSRERLMLEAERDSLIEQLRSLSSTDYLTGLPNRRAFFEAAEREMAWAQRHGQPVVLILLDIDHFKAFNDRHGHSVGDQALMAVAQAIRGTLRAGDWVARFGGEEFVLLMAGCDLPAGLQFAERLRHTIAEVRLLLDDDQPLEVTASLGLADSGRFGLDLPLLLASADAAMYAAKAQGRNRVVPAQPGGGVAAN